MVALPDRPSMSAEEYLAWEPTQEERYEYWDGEVVAIGGETRNHIMSDRLTAIPAVGWVERSENPTPMDVGFSL